MKKQDIEMDDIGHLREAKNRILFTMIWFGVAFLVSYYFSVDLMNFITERGKTAGYQFVYISPTEVLMSQLKITVLAALVFTLPVIVINVACYVGPALERGAIAIIIPSIMATIMFAIGMAFSYMVLMPFVFNTLLDIGVTSNITAQVSVENYISLYLTLLVSLGVIFQLPLVTMILGNIGLVNSKLMKKGRKVAIVLALLLSALITPPDVFSQVIVTIPIVILYELSIKLCKRIERKKNCEVNLQCE